MNKQRLPVNYVILAFILIGSALLMTHNISQSWVGIVEADGALFSQIAENYLRYGIWNLHFGQATTPMPVTDLAQLHYYQHHPALLPLLTAGSFVLFGESEAAARGLPIVLTLGSITLLFFISRRIYDESLALLATGIFATLPAILFIGRKPGYEAPTLFFILLTLGCYLNYRESKRGIYLTGLFASLGAALMTDWPAYLLVPALAIHYGWYEKNNRIINPIVLGLPLFSLAMLCLFGFFSYLSDPQSIESVVYQGMTYMGLIGKDTPLALIYTEATVTFTPMQFIMQTLGKIDNLYAYPVPLMALFGAWFERNERDASRTLVWTLVFVALSYCIIFYRSVYIHLWHTYYFTAPMAIFAAIAIRKLFVWHNQDRYTPKVTLVFVMALILSGAVPKLLGLYSLQIKLLPGDQLEQSDFLKAVAIEIKRHSEPDDIVISPLPPNAAHIISYYSGREVFLGKTTVQDTIASTSRRIHYFDLMPTTSVNSESVSFSHAKRQEFTVQGHRFIWLTQIEK
ncbi:MAG: glycosyltransferase family 39 protein [Methylococcaceae bacterium]